MDKPHIAFQEATHHLRLVQEALAEEISWDPDGSTYHMKGVEGAGASFVGVGFAPVPLLLREEHDETKPLQFFYCVMDAMRCDYLRGPQVTLEIRFDLLSFAVFKLARPFEILSRMDLAPLHDAMAPLSDDPDVALQEYVPALYEAARELGHDSIVIRPSAYEAGYPYRFGPPSLGGEGPAAPQVIVPPDEDVTILLETAV